ncbi:hypothetical protein ROS62_12960 [Streptomyces sp. DSM 41972]|uniref:Uncharacterized protein n=1 Tax=Streptomyces althioticus subsp. attaecolombicae TaxID=3075534 RepID=A0ABU3HYI8_9ACTN|nr:hypothetical protein [Streptomyces sp. DSM 41972]SCE44786.1 hypothetical protein GA0115245_13851 [Streptomyces sp. di188]
MPQRGGAAAGGPQGGLLAQMDLLMAALDADLSALDADLSALDAELQVAGGADRTGGRGEAPGASGGGRTEEVRASATEDSGGRPSL